jgi:hypothetical protein
VLKKDQYYPDHPNEKWSQVVGFRSPQDAGLENVSVYAKELDPGITQHMYANRQIRRLNSVLESSQAVIADSQAYMVRYGGKYDVLEVWIVKANKVYTIRFMTELSYFSTTIFESMIHSFEIRLWAN